MEIHERLKRELVVVRHESKELTKQLKNNTKKLEYQSMETKLSTDVKYLR